ncbi:MAG: MBL fold metallo-hydrolase [Candidatus Erginobacter occultus]|nr:MBL fold metallo-hydrolase [Candidatus Erginobacter occultus]
MLIILPALLLLSCGGESDGPSSSDTIDLNVENFPEHQYNDFPPRPDADQVIAAGEAVKLTFYGATRIVGGSCILLEYRGKKILIDAGIFYLPSLIPLDLRFEFDPSEIDHVILTHAHGDHNARLPLLYKRGYHGKIYGTPPTRDISDIMLQLGVGMSARRYRVDFRNKTVHSRDCDNIRNLPEGEFLDVIDPRTWENNLSYRSCWACWDMVTRDKAVLSGKIEYWFQTVEPEELVELDEAIHFRLHNAGHILGSSQVELILGEGEEAITLVLLGDYGNQISPLLRRPDQIERADYLITESTYGTVRKEFREPYFADFINSVIAAVHRGERVIIPSFVLSKAQKIITVLAEEAYLGRIPNTCPIIITSPTVKALNEVYNNYLQSDPEAYFSEHAKRRQKWRNPFKNEQFFYGTVNSYQAKFGKIPTPAIFLVSSGMMDFASALELAEQYLGDRRSNFFIPGWQSPESIGRAAMELEQVVIKGKLIPVLAQVKKFGQFSSHGDLTMLLENIRNMAGLKGVLVQHGEAESAVNLAHLVKEDYGHPVFVPAFLDTLWLDKQSFLKVEHDFSDQAQQLRQLDPVLELPRATLRRQYQVAYNNLAQAEEAYRGENRALALKYASDAVRRYPALADAYYLMGTIYEEKGMAARMLETYRRAVESNPYDGRFYLGLARGYLAAGEVGEAIEKLRTGLYYRPDNIEALALLGEIFLAGDRVRAGLELLKAANSIDPYNEPVSVKLEEAVRQQTGQPGSYVASRNGKIFHYGWCPLAVRIREQNLVRLKSRSAALKKGYRPCLQCNP